MWIYTQSGNLCNLSRATDVMIRLNTAGEKKLYDVRVNFDESDHTIVSVHEKKDDAVTVMGDIARLLCARVVSPARIV